MNIVIVGGGFAGVRAALELGRLHIGRITLVSDTPYLAHHDALQLARRGTDTVANHVSLDELCAEFPAIRVVHDTAMSIDVERKLLVGEHASYDYDKLVMALGAVPTNRDTSSLATLQQLYTELSTDLEAGRRFDRAVTVVGGGREGVEMAGAVHDYAQALLAKFPTSHSKVRVTLVEQQPTLLPRHSPQARRHVQRRLTHRGIDLQLHTTAKRKADFTHFGTHKRPYSTTLWVNGSVSNPFYGDHPQLFQLDADGRVDVDPHLEAYPHIYVIGQNIAVRGALTVKGTLDMADFVVDHLLRVSTGRHPLPYHPSSVITTIVTDSDWAYVECFGVYVTRRFGHWLATRVEATNIRKIMSPMLAKIFVVRSTAKKSHL